MCVFIFETSNIKQKLLISERLTRYLEKSGFVCVCFEAVDAEAGWRGAFCAGSKLEIFFLNFCFSTGGTLVFVVDCGFDSLRLSLHFVIGGTHLSVNGFPEEQCVIHECCCE